MLNIPNIRWHNSVGKARSGSVWLLFDRRSGPGTRRLLAPLVGDEGREPGRERDGEPGKDCY